MTSAEKKQRYNENINLTTFKTYN